ncbi:hypothetical protein EMCRGX_G027873 [Ephydatia muelleri]
MGATPLITCIFALLLLLLSKPLEAAQCMPDNENPCIAMCNGTTFDITKVFDYPVNITDSRGYYYLFSPCKGYSCPGGEQPITDTAVCQKADQFYTCGRTEKPIVLWGLTYEPYIFSFQYPWGVDWRRVRDAMAINPTQTVPTIKFLSEDPLLQYNFEVRGKCIGQPYCND